MSEMATGFYKIPSLAQQYLQGMQRLVLILNFPSQNKKRAVGESLILLSSQRQW